jgi:hypothetical protein
MAAAPVSLGRTGFSPSKIFVVGGPVVLYTLVSLLFFGWLGDYSSASVGCGADPENYIWSMNWWPWAIGQGINPLISQFVWYPSGFHMAWADAVPGAAILASPLTILSNAAVAYNFAMLLAPALAAWCAFFLIRYITHNSSAAIVAAYFFGFSSYQLSQMFGHLSLVLIFPVPLVLLATLKRIARETSRSRFVLTLTGCLLLQFGFSLEIFATVCTLGTFTWLVATVLSPTDTRRRLYLVVPEFLLSAAMILVVTSPWLISMWRGAMDVPDVINVPSTFSTDLLNFVVPTRVTWFGSSTASVISSRFLGNLSEQGGYLSPLVLIILSLWLIRNFATHTGRIAAVMLLLLMTFSLGPTVLVEGTVVGIAAPWRLFLHLPLIRHALPGRFSMYVSLAAAVIIGCWLATPRTFANRVSRFGFAALAVMVLLPNPSLPRWCDIPFVPFFDQRVIQRVLGPMPNIVVLPTSRRSSRGSEAGPSMIWQWEAKMAFTQSEGYVGNIPPEASTWSAVTAFNSGTVGGHFRHDIEMYAAANKISAIVAGPGTPRSLLDPLENLGWREELVGNCYIFHVPDLRGYPFYHISGQYWPIIEDWGWMGHKITISATGGDFVVMIRGRSRPPSAGAATLHIVTRDTTSAAIVGPDTGVTAIPLPAGSELSILTESTFTPDDFFRNRDPRSVSAEISVIPPPPLLVTGDYWDGSGAWSWIGRNVVVRAQYPITLQFSGRDRPIGLPAVQVEVSDGEASTSYVVGRERTLTVPIPPGRDVRVRSTPTFFPDTMLHNGDARELSLLIKRGDDK